MSLQIRNMPSSSSALPPRAREHGQPLRAIGQALRAGDLAAASTAYSALADKATRFTTNNPDAPFSRLGAALAAGDLAGAKSAFAAMFTSRMPVSRDERPAPPDVVTDPVASASGQPGSLLNVSA
jgi:hypothetical protein